MLRRARPTDAFERMAAQSARRNGPRNSAAPFSGQQIGVARHYAAMAVTRRNPAQLRRYHAAIGTGLAVQRVRRSQPGTRQTISDRALVDQVCIGARTLSEVLRAFGWSSGSRNIKALRAILCTILDRMIPVA